MNDHDRLHLYVERRFARSGRMSWPTVRQAAHALRWTHVRVQDACEGDPGGRLFTTSYHAALDPPIGEHFVESFVETNLTVPG